jgi:opacity protein-like surface antigen
MYRGKIMGACMVAGLLASGAARAEDSGFYLGASVGQASQSGGEFDGEDMSFRLLGGYSINQYIAAEAGYVDAGKQTDRIEGTDVEIKSDGFLVAALLKLPIGDYVAPFAKVGYAFYDNDVKISQGGQSLSGSESDEDLLYGVGCEFKLGDRFRLRAEYEQVDIPDGDFEIISLTGVFQF